MNNMFGGEKVLTIEEFNSMSITERFRWFREHGYVEWPETDYAATIRQRADKKMDYEKK